MARKQISIQNGDGVQLATVAAYVGPDVITIKRLGWRRLDEAERAQIRQALAHVRDIGGPAVVKELQEAGGRQVVDETAKRDPMAAFDKATLLTIGVTGIDGQAATHEQMDDWEPETAKAVATAIVRLSRPDLFEDAEARKND